MTRKTRIGIIGGMGSRAGAELFDKIIEYSPALKDQDFPEILLHNNSCIPDRTQAILYEKESALPELLRSVQLMNLNETDLIVMACITSYFYYHDVIKHTKARIISPVISTADHIKNMYPEIKSIGLLATTGTIRSGLFDSVFETEGLKIVTLSEKEQEDYFMTSVYMKNGLKSAIISQEAKDLLLAAALRLKERGAMLLIGGCSEVQLVIKKSVHDLPFVDAMDVMAREVVQSCYGVAVSPLMQ